LKEDSDRLTKTYKFF